IASLHSDGGDHISLVAVGVLQQRDVGRTDRVILDAVDLRRNSVFSATEVDHPVHLLVPTAAVPGGDLALIVPTAGFRLALEQVPLGRVARGQFRKVADRRVASSGACRLVDSNAHNLFNDWW